MQPGTNWVEEIDRRIEWCHYLVVLLSQHSIHSERVQGEVRRAHHRRKADGIPMIVPVRIQYDGSLGYELDSYLYSINYTRWNKPADTQRILAELLQIARNEIATPRHSGRPQESAALDIAPDSHRPLPSADPRIVRAAIEDPSIARPPGGTISPTDRFYVERASDAHVRARASIRGDTLAIKATRQMGKSSLL